MRRQERLHPLGGLASIGLIADAGLVVGSRLAHHWTGDEGDHGLDVAELVGVVERPSQRRG